MREAGISDWDWPEMLAETGDWQALLIAETEGRPLGFLQIIDPAREPSDYWGACGPGFRALDIWSGAAEDLGKGFGSEMMQQAFSRCFADPDVNAVLVDPLPTNTRSHAFYQRLGFTFLEQRRLGGDDCFVFELTRAAWRLGD